MIPLYFNNSYKLHHIIFANDVEDSQIINFSNPNAEGLNGAYNRYVITEDHITIGVWQVLPRSKIRDVPSSDSEKDVYFFKELSNSKEVVLYCHGNKPSRAKSYRVLLYKVLQNLDYHTIAFDYRGFADSEKMSPTEKGLVKDVLFMFKWIRSLTNASILVYGHSLGAAIATEAVSNLCERNACPNALVLQSPFTSIYDQLHYSHLTTLFRFLPWFDYAFVRPFINEDLIFNTSKHILNVKCPILILHAEDDVVVPYALGEKLYRFSKIHRPKSYGSLKFASFEAKKEYGHNYICASKEFPDIIRKFFIDAKSFTTKYLQ